MRLLRPRAAPPAGGGEQPASETAFFAQLEELNQTDKPRALDWARRGDNWYGNAGVFAEARQAMQVTLLVDLGRMDPVPAARLSVPPELV